MENIDVFYWNIIKRHQPFLLKSATISRTKFRNRVETIIRFLKVFLKREKTLASSQFGSCQIGQ